MNSNHASAGLPPGVQPNKRTPVFTETSVPAGLLKDHSTKEGVWGIIHVEQGELEYTITDQGVSTRLNPNTQGLVRPTELHHVKPVGPCRFFVEFWR